ncbi:MAG: hypothetical protein ACI8UX_001597, partial [Psychromonas sp.]
HFLVLLVEALFGYSAHSLKFSNPLPTSTSKAFIVQLY